MTSYNWTGIDVSIEISLGEYGVICTQDAEDCTGENEYFVLYAVHEGYGTGFVKEEELDEIAEGKSWDSNPGSFLSFVGHTLPGWLRGSFETKLHDLINYYGCENIMGASYCTITKEEILDIYGIDLEN